MGASYNVRTGTVAHQHSSNASDGGSLSLTVTEVNDSPLIGMMVALG